MSRSGPAPATTADANDAAGQPEAPLVRRTRRRLIAWSGGSTLVVLLVLGVAIYGAAASSLSATGAAALRTRVDEMTATQQMVVPLPPVPGIAGGSIVTTDASQPGFVFGGKASGTFAVLASAAVIRSGQLPVISSLADPGAINAAVDEALRSGRVVVHETSVDATPVRLLVAPVDTTVGTMVAVVVGDRTAEVELLQTLLRVLLVGGIAVFAASILVGYVYAGRALVPIRESLRRQREFAADASHELRTPLSIARAAIAELHRGRGDPVVVDRAIEDLEAGTTRLASLVEDLLLLARTDAEAIELVVTDTDLALVAAETAESFEALAGARSVRLLLDLEPAPAPGDEARLRQLAGILLDNAIRHSPQDGRVTITVRAGATLVVEDEGPGIAPGHEQRVFERFWRAPGAPHGGTGLGLAIARWIAERHGGTITADNRAGRSGARFAVRLPGR